MYSIVEFNDGILAIPSIWVKADKKSCFYPPYKKDKKVIDAIKKVAKPSEDWKIHPIKKIFGTAENYQDGKSKVEVAMLESDLDDEKLKKNRHRRKKKRNSSCSDSDSSSSVKSDEELESRELNNIINKSKCTESLTNYTTPPLGHTVNNNENDMNAINIYEETDLGKMSSNTQFKLKDKKSNQSLISIGEKLDYIIAMGEASYRRTSRILLDLNILQNRLKKIEDLNNSVTTAIAEDNTMKGVHDFKTFLDSYCPMNTLYDFDKIEEKLKDKEFKQFMIKEMKGKGGQDYADLLNNILFKILADSLAHMFSFKGKNKEKKCFDITRVSACVIHAVREVFPNATESSIEKKVSGWLANAHTRLIRKRLLESTQKRSISGETQSSAESSNRSRSNTPKSYSSIEKHQTIGRSRRRLFQTSELPLKRTRSRSPKNRMSSCQKPQNVVPSTAGIPAFSEVTPIIASPGENERLQPADV